MKHLKIFENFDPKDGYWDKNWESLIELSEHITDNGDWKKYCKDEEELGYINDSTHKHRALFLLNVLSTEKLDELIDKIGMENTLSNAKGIIDDKNKMERDMVDITDYRSVLNIKQNKVIFARDPKIGQGGNVGKVIITITEYDSYEDRKSAINGKVVSRFTHIEILDPIQYENIHHLMGDPKKSPSF